MIESVEIIDNTNTPLRYISDLPNFANGKKYNFTKGINVIIGKNGCGKSTLLRLISQYCLCENKNFSSLEGDVIYSLDCLFEGSKFHSGILVKSDYWLQIFNYIVHKNLKQSDIYSSFNNFASYCNSVNKSTGEMMLTSFDNLMNLAFSKEDLIFPIKELEEIRCNDFWRNRINTLLEYYKENTIPKERIVTFLLDEPDRNLDIDHIDEIYDILSFKRDDIQLISVIHNPIIIYKLSKLDYINFIEMTDGYLNQIKKVFNEIN